MTTRPLASGDAAESSLASYWHDAASAMDSQIEAEAIREFVEHHEPELEDYGRRIACEVIRMVFTDVASRNNPAVSLTAFFVAMGFNSVTTETLETIGEKFGLTKQAVSKELQYFRDKFGSPRLGASKSEETREISRRAQNEYYERNTAEDTNGFGFDDFFKSVRN